MKVLIGLSGGFDSAYSARLLQEEGHTVEGAVLDMHGYTEIDEARAAADALKIPLHVICCRALFDLHVAEDFCREYLAGRTPNPCVVCNEKVKFRALFDYAVSHGFDRIATGHYARITDREGVCAVSVAADKSKDQSYMLYRLPREIREKLLLPMGNIIKKEAKVSRTAGALVAAQRPESQDVCFVGEEGYADYIERRFGPSTPGDFIGEGGEVLGKHNGIIRYTVGQRKGLGISARSRLYIRRIDPETNTILLTPTASSVRRFLLRETVFSGLTREEALSAGDLTVRVRYTAPPVSARIWEEDGALWVELKEDTAAVVAPGQSAVFYSADAVAFGGFIERVL